MATCHYCGNRECAGDSDACNPCAAEWVRRVADRECARCGRAAPNTENGRCASCGPGAPYVGYPPEAVAQ